MSTNYGFPTQLTDKRNHWEYTAYNL